jgi:hypothetical protein
LRELADDFLRRYHPTGDLPVPIERIVEFQFELDIVPVPGLKSEFDVDAFITSDLAEIRVDQFIQQHRETRYRFSLAHEIAHFVLHQDVFERLKFSTVQGWKEAMRSIPERQYFFIEQQGYAFAGLILVPSAPLRALFDESLADAARAGIVLNELGDRARKMIQEHIGTFFGVSGEVIGRRLAKDGLWT